jgi:hypothetical protein
VKRHCRSLGGVEEFCPPMVAAQRQDSAQLRRRRPRSATSGLRVRREKAALSSGCEPHPATAPAGSNRSSHGRDETAEAFGVACHVPAGPKMPALHRRALGRRSAKSCCWIRYRKPRGSGGSGTRRETGACALKRRLWVTTRMAIGSIAACAAMLPTDIIAVASRGT